MKKKNKFKTFLSELIADKVRLITVIILFIIMMVTLTVVVMEKIKENKQNEETEKVKGIFFEAHMATEAPTESPQETELKPTEIPIPTERPVLQSIQSIREYYGNDDIVGYLVVPGTEINQPIVQYTDNDFYLHRDLYKVTQNYGAIFMDYENDVSKEDKNIILYGHNMKQKIMFHELRYYNNLSYYNEHKYAVLTTLYDTLVWEIFACYEVNVNDFYYIQVKFGSDDKFYELASEMKERSTFDTGVEITKEDRVLTLSTCTNKNPDTRIVVNAKLITNSDDIPEDILNSFFNQ